MSDNTTTPHEGLARELAELLRAHDGMQVESESDARLLELIRQPGYPVSNAQLAWAESLCHREGKCYCRNED